MKECITHHYACDCREARIKLILRVMLAEHTETRRFLAGFGKFEPCQCMSCKMIRELYPDLGNEAVERFHKHVAVWESKAPTTLDNGSNINA